MICNWSGLIAVAISTTDQRGFLPNPEHSTTGPAHCRVVTDNLSFDISDCQGRQQSSGPQKRSPLPLSSDTSRQPSQSTLAAPIMLPLQTAAQSGSPDLHQQGTANATAAALPPTPAQMPPLAAEASQTPLPTSTAAPWLLTPEASSIAPGGAAQQAPLGQPHARATVRCRAEHEAPGSKLSLQPSGGAGEEVGHVEQARGAMQGFWKGALELYFGG